MCRLNTYIHAIKIKYKFLTPLKIDGKLVVPVIQFFERLISEPQSCVKGSRVTVNAPHSSKNDGEKVKI